jgi:hypothetical protein
MEEWINKENAENPFRILEKCCTRIVEGLTSLEMYTLIDFSVIYGMECGS